MRHSPSAMETSESSWSLLTLPTAPTQSMTSMMTNHDPPISSWGVDPSIVLPPQGRETSNLMSHNRSTDPVILSLGKPSSSLDSVSKSFASHPMSFHDRDPILTINVTAPSNSPQIRNIYSHGGTQVSGSLNDPLVSGRQSSMLSLTRSSVGDRSLLTTTEEKSKRIFFAQTTPVMYSTKIQESFPVTTSSLIQSHENRIIFSSAAAGFNTSPSSCSLEVSENLLTSPPTVASLQLRPAILSELNHPAKISNPNVQLLDPNLSVVSDAATSYTSSPTLVRIVTPQSISQASLNEEIVPIQLLPVGPVMDPMLPSTLGTPVRLLPSEFQSRPQKLVPACVVQIRPLPQQTKTSKEATPARSTTGKMQSGFVESVSCFKCSLCGFLSLTSQNVTDHLTTDHNLNNRDHQNDEINWMEVAKKENILLECPLCTNTFQKEGHRSFTIHLMDDHGLNEVAAETKFTECSQLRRNKTIALINDRKKLMEKNDGDTLQAYITPQGELRVRAVRKDTSSLHDSANDISASEYLANGPKIASVSRKMATKDKSKTQISPRKGLGRPKGSRSIGLTRLKKLNPNIEIQIGSECGIGNCVVRLKDNWNLEYHRRSHSNDNPGMFECRECNDLDPRSFDRWQKMALHLWRNHSIDMELYSCPKCSKFRSFTRWCLMSHMLIHQSERPFLCSHCGKKFKTSKQLGIHSGIHLFGPSEDKSEAIEKLTCKICERSFNEKRRLRYHIEAVHQKKRPHLCNICGYAASCRSTFKLHQRTHTGEKPYSCDTCEFQTADHNSLRRHKMRHSGKSKYQCAYCSYTSIQSSTYKSHLKRKHPEKTDGLIFQCGQCNFKTVKEENYLTHCAANHQTKIKV